MKKIRNILIVHAHDMGRYNSIYGHAIETPHMQELERRNVANDPAYADVLTEMEARLQDWMKKTHDPLLSGPLVVPAGSTICGKDSLTTRDKISILSSDRIVN